MQTTDSPGPSAEARSLPPLRAPLWVHASALGGIFALILLLAAISMAFPGRNVWDGRTEAHDLRHPGYAEKIYDHDVFRTRANPWSNLAYVLVGFYGLALGISDSRQAAPANSGYLVRTPELSLLFGFACCYLGVGSGLFHASLTRFGQQLDVAAMYAPLLAFLAVGAGRLMPTLRFGAGTAGFASWPILSGLAVLAGFLLFLYKWSMRSSVVLPTLILIVAGLALLDQLLPQRKFAVGWMWLAGVALVAARI